MGTLFRIQNSIEINRPASDVWDIVIQPQKYITYSDEFRFSDQKLRLGSTAEVTIGPSWYQVTYRAKVTEFEEGKSYTLEGRSSQGWESRLHVYLDSDRPNTTRVTRVKEYELPLSIFSGLVNSLFFKRRYTKMEKRELQQIKRLAEGKL